MDYCKLAFRFNQSSSTVFFNQSFCIICLASSCLFIVNATGASVAEIS